MRRYISSAAVVLLSLQSATFADLSSTKRAIAELGPVGRARSEWYLKITVGDYDAAGDRDPKWDDAAHTLLCATAANFGRLPIDGWDGDFIAYEQSDIAMKAGCNDPLILYCRARALDYYGLRPQEIYPLFLRALDGFAQRNYNPRWIACVEMRMAARHVLDSPWDDQVRAGARARLTASLEPIARVFADKTLPIDEITSLLTVAGEVSQVVEKDRLTFARRVIELLEASPQPRSAVLTGRGFFDLVSARGALGRTRLRDATPDQLQVLGANLANARQELEEAFKLDPASSLAARWMIDVELVDSHGRPAMEQWFARATAADPDDWRAYQGKMDWIMACGDDPEGDSIAFGRECAKSDRWAARIPLTLADVYWYRARSAPRAGNPAAQRLYFSASPEKWEELQPVFDRYLQEPNASDYYRTLYAVMAAYSGKWKEADAMFTQLGPHASPIVMSNNQSLLALAREAAAKARPAPDNGSL
jgi:hypothetical protein